MQGCTPQSFHTPMNQNYYTAPNLYLAPASVLEAQSKVQYQQVMAGIEISKKEALASISIQESKAMAQIRSDVAAQRELQHTYVFVSDDGTVLLQKEQFGADIKGKLPVTICQSTRLKAIGGSSASEALIIQVKTKNERIVDLVFYTNQLDNRFIRQQFDRAGISFGFGCKKEMEIKKGLVLSQMNTVTQKYVPARHGWYQIDGQWHYAFPNDPTWKEIERWI